MGRSENPLLAQGNAGPVGPRRLAKTHTGRGLGRAAGSAEKAPQEVRRRGGETSARAGVRRGEPAIQDSPTT